MSFTLLSAALLLCVGAGVIPKVMRGYRQGLTRTAISLSAVIFSALVAAPLAVWLSDYPANLLGLYLPRLLPALKNYIAQFPSLEILLPVAIDAVLSPLLFVVIFLLVWAVICRPVEGLLHRLLAPKPHDPSDPIYESRNAPWHRRHSRLLGGITGGICGFIVTLVLLSPLLGLLSVADTALTTAEQIRVKWSAYGLNEGQVQLMQDVVEDPVAEVLEAAGGGLLFDATATTYINGRRVTLRDEVDVCADLVADTMSSMSTLKNMANIPADKRDTLAGLGGKIDRSEAAKLVAADVVNMAAGAWMRGNTFMKVPCPKLNEHLEPLLDGLLEVCARSTPSCVGRDISTVMDVCITASDSGLMTKKLSYAELAASLDSGGVIDRIYNEIMDNPCTASLAGRMTEVALRMMATAIDGAGFDRTQLNGLMTHLSDSLNRVNGMGITGAERVEHMKEYTTYYAKMYGMNIPDSLAEVAAVAFVEKLGNTGSRITAEQLYGLLEQYMN